MSEKKYFEVISTLRGWRKPVKKVYVSKSMGSNGRGRLLGRWKDRAKEYMCEKSATREKGFKQARRD